MKIYQSITDLIGNTPIIELANYRKNKGLNARILGKAEYLNPAGSSKDRIGLAMIEDAEKKGLLKKGSVIIESTSGNTGIGLAAAAAVKGYKAIFVMPETMSKERQTFLKAYGAEVVLTPGSRGTAGSVEKAKELSQQIPNSFVPDQFSNPINPEIHYRTTGPEIWKQTEGKVDFFVSPVGTGGTISGVGRYLKEQNPNIKIIAVEPKSSPLLSEGRSGSHGIQGIGTNFIPKTLDTSIYDEVIAVTDEDAFQTGREFGKMEGFLVGISSGASLWAAAQLAKRPENKDKIIVAFLPDGGDRYLSTKLYSD